MPQWQHTGSEMNYRLILPARKKKNWWIRAGTSFLRQLELKLLKGAPKFSLTLIGLEKMFNLVTAIASLALLEQTVWLDGVQEVCVLILECLFGDKEQIAILFTILNLRLGQVVNMLAKCLIGGPVIILLQESYLNSMISIELFLMLIKLGSSSIPCNTILMDMRTSYLPSLILKRITFLRL